MRKEIDLSKLPRWQDTSHKGQIDWIKTIGMEVPFIYNDINDKVQIMRYDKKFLYLKYKNISEFPIGTGSFTNCNLGLLLKLISSVSIKIGDIIKDEKRDLEIIDETYETYKKNKYNQNRKRYKYHCNKCGYEKWITEGHLLDKTNPVGCACCAGQDVVEGINDIATTDPWMIDYFQEKDKWMTKKYSHSCRNKIIPICPECKRILNKEVYIANIYKRHSIGCPHCGDGISYPEKFMCNVLEQVLNDKFTYQLTRKHYKWIGKYKYDFYFKLNGREYIIETDGGFHKKGNRMTGQTAAESKEIDDLKDELATKQGINVIRIDCYESTLNYIREKIKESELNDLFDLNNIDWNKCEASALSNRVKEACELKQNNSALTTTDIGKIMDLSRITIAKYLKKGTEIGWCKYNPQNEIKKSSSKVGINKGKHIEIFKNNISLGKFRSLTDLANQSLNLFKIQLYRKGIRDVCSGKTKEYNGFTFKLIN